MSILQKFYHTLFVDGHDEQPEPPAPIKAPKPPEKPAPANPPAIPQKSEATIPQKSAPKKGTVNTLEISTESLLDTGSSAAPSYSPSEPSRERNEKDTPSATQRMLQRVLDEAKGEQAWQPPSPFYLADGRTLRGPRDLTLAAQDMSEETFRHHVTDERNDFADWIAAVFGDADLAGAIAQARSKDALLATLRTPPLPQVPTHELPVPDSEALLVIDRSSEQAFRDEITGLRSEIDGLRHALTEEIASSLTAMEREHAMQRELREQLLSVTKRAERAETELEGSRAQLAKERKRLEQAWAEMHQDHSASESLRKQLTSLEEEVARKRDELKAAQEALIEHRRQLEETRTDLDRVQQELLAHARGKHASETIRGEPFESVSAGAVRILDLLGDGRNALEFHNVAAARQAYARARELFYSTDMQDADRQELYSLLRELYTDIELASLD